MDDEYRALRAARHGGRDAAPQYEAEAGNGPSHFTFAVDGDRVRRMTIRA